VPSLESCPQIVQLEGDSALTPVIGQALRRRGIDTQPQGGCPAVHALVQRRGGLLAITVNEEVRLGERMVADVGTAVSVIESWVRSDISAPLLAAPPPAPSESPPLAPAVAVAPAPPAAGPPPRTRFDLELLAEVGVDKDAATWVGASLRGCLAVKALCLGLAWRMAGDLPGGAPSGLIDQLLSSEILGTLAVPLRAGRFRFVPSVGLGAGWLRHQVHGTISVDSGDSASDERKSRLLVVNDASAQDGGFRAEVRLLGAVQLHAGMELALGISLGASFLDSKAVSVQVASNVAQPLAAAPWGTLRLGLGLRWNRL
jgi:hypothetical protein